MRKYLPAVAAAVLLAVAALAPAPAVAASSAAKVQTQESRIGGFRGTRPNSGSRYRRPSYRPRARTYRRPSLFRGILQALGLAYLFHLLFGWGPGGGSPFGLLIILAFVAWLVTRRRARRMSY
jgi:uncharacterized membrane protein